MSDRLSKEERRNIRRTLGETAAGALGEAKAEVQRCRGELLQAMDLVRALDERTKLHTQRLDAVAKLGFDTEKKIGEERSHRLKLAEEQRIYVDAQDRKILVAFEAFRARGFLSRLTWLFLGHG